MFRTPPMQSMIVATNAIRDGRRVRVVDASIRCADLEVARARALLLRIGRHPSATLWRAPDWDAPQPKNCQPQMTETPLADVTSG